MANPVRLLIIEDCEADATLIVRALQRGSLDIVFERVDSADGMKAALDRQSWDLIISDYSMPNFGGSAALALYQERGLDIPFIFVSGTLGEETAVAMMKAGAHDYVMKDRMSRLAPAVIRELHSAQEREARRQAESALVHLASIVESCDDAIIGTALDGTVRSWNVGAERLYLYTAAEMVGRSISVLMTPYRPHELPEMLEQLKRGEHVERVETVRIRKDGKSVEVSLTVSPIKDRRGELIGASTVARDISQRKQEESDRLKLIQDLMAALGQGKKMGGTLPICTACKRIFNEQAGWQSVESYFKEHSDATLTQSLCPECMTRFIASAA